MIRSTPDVVLTNVPIAPDPEKELKGVTWIEHRVLTVIGDIDPKTGQLTGLRFSVNIPKTDTLRADVYDYIPKILGYQIPPGGTMTDTLWNIELPNCDPGAIENEPRILILQLDNAIDWEFSSDDPGVTAKVETVPQDPLENCSVYFVDDKGVWSGPGEKAPPNCRLLYWSVLARPKNAAGYYGRRFNFYINFIDSITGQRMRTVFDPSIPDQGGGSIP